LRTFLAAAILLAAAPAVADPPPAAPAAPTEVGRFSGWTVYTLPDGKRSVCYAVSAPAKADDAVRRGKPNLMVTHRPAERVFNVVSVLMGYDLPANGSAEVSIGKTNFDFFTKDQSAWSRDADTDKAVVAAMAQGQELVIKAKSAKGKPTADTYSLAGFTQALNSIDKYCKYKR
jgi:invasion protein IalB